MKIALVDHTVSAGGVSRFLYGLTRNLARQHPDHTFALISSEQAVERDHLHDAFADCPNVDVLILPQPARISTAAEEEVVTRGRSSSRRWIVGMLKRNMLLFNVSLMIYRWLKTHVLGAPMPWYRFRFTADAVRMLNTFDLVYFAWPFFMQPAHLRPPVVGTFHDLHFKRFPESYHVEMLRILESQTRWWLRSMSEVVVSTQYIADEIERFYPAVARSVNVVYLAPYALDRISASEIATIRETHSVPDKYMIYSGGRSRHKNIISLFEALSHLREAGEEIPLVITGLGTEIIGQPNPRLPRGYAGEELNFYLRDSNLIVGRDVIPLGYVSNRDVDALTQGATIVVSASLYEAGCGPAMDAWQSGIPVAFSGIAPFVEQLEVLGVQAWVFDPKDPQDIAARILEILGDPETRARVIAESKASLGQYTWDKVASGYFKVFERALGLDAAGLESAAADEADTGTFGVGRPR